MQFKFIFLLLLMVIPIAIACNTGKQKSLRIGDIAPNFILLDENEQAIALKDFANKKIVLYFYPKDNTPNCTKEACQLRDAFAIYKKNNIIILGVSYDSPQSHAKFKNKNNLPFTLLSDQSGDVAKLYGANTNLLSWFFPDRKTILIDENGKVIQIFKDVDVKTHSEKILKAFNIKN